MTSCMENYYVTSETTFKDAIRSISSQMAERGYYYSGYETVVNNNIKAAQDNNGMEQRATVYHFADSLGNTMKYTVVYGEKPNGRAGRVYNVDFCECEVSDPKDDERLCDIVMQNMPQKYKSNSYKKEDLEVAISLVQSQLSSQGFKITGQSKATPSLEKTFGPRLDSYHFVDSLGNTANYSIKYIKGNGCVDYVELCSCETSNPKDSEMICGEDGLVKQLTELPKDQEAKRLTSFGAIMGLGGVMVVIMLPIVLLIGLIVAVD